MTSDQTRTDVAGTDTVGPEPSAPNPAMGATGARGLGTTASDTDDTPTQHSGSDELDLDAIERELEEIEARLARLDRDQDA